MKNIEYLIGSEKTIRTPMQAYADEVCDFMNEISSEIMKSPQSRIFPDISALAFWCRKGNIQKLKIEFGYNDRLGRGLCFHVAPSNIPINFVFSYFFSLLAGNANIVRLPSKTFAQVDYLCEVFGKILATYPNIKSRTAFIKYPVDNTITAEFCKIADARMIWGGDNTIKSIKMLEAKPRCVDITFADRYSICIIDANKILELNDDSITRLGENFYNDTYLMDQNACSSPQLILWLNDNDKARNKFWDVVYDLAAKKYELQDAVSVDKYTKMCEDAIDLKIVKKLQRSENLLYRIEISELVQNMENIRGKGGYFYEYSLKDFNEMFKIVSEKYQTVTYFGINAKELKHAVIQNNLRGIDRIVPVGKAMDIGVIWDGHDLVRELSREITVI